MLRKFYSGFPGLATAMTLRDVKAEQISRLASR
jgi:hypothetical protein